MGVWEEKQRFEYTLKVGTYKTKSYLRFMKWQAQRAMKRIFETGKPTIIVHDNASIHRSKLVKKTSSKLAQTRFKRIFSSALFSRDESYRRTVVQSLSAHVVVFDDWRFGEPRSQTTRIRWLCI